MNTFIAGIQQDYLINAIIFIVIALLIVSIITRSITKPLASVIEATRKIAGGNLQIAVETNTKDQIANVAENFNNMVESLRDLVGKINLASENVTSMSQELSANSEEASAASEEVAATSEEIATGTEDIEAGGKDQGNPQRSRRESQQCCGSYNKVALAIEEASAKSSQGINVINRVSQNILNILNEVDNPVMK